MDRIDAMQAYSAVVMEGSFSRAAERLNLSPQLVSKYVAQLENHLRTRLLNRTTRRVSVTEAGQAYFERCQQILSDIEQLETTLGNLHQQATGLLRISAPMSFGMHHLAEPLVEFQNRYPDVRIDLQLNDRKVDIVEEGFDIALRVGKLESSSLVAKKIAPVRLVTCASPDYLREHGKPHHPDDLAQHRFMRYSYMAEGSPFRNVATVGKSLLKFDSPFVANNGDVLVNAAVQGAGIVVQPTFIAGSAIASGKLEVVLEAFEPEPLALYAVYAHRHYLTNKVRSFIDFISDYYGSPPYWDCF